MYKIFFVIAIVFAIIAIITPDGTTIKVTTEDGVTIPTKHLTPVINLMTLDAVSLSVLVETQKAIEESYAIHVKRSVRNAYAHAMYKDYEQADAKVASDLKPHGIHVVKLHVYKNVETIEFKAVDLP